MASPVNFSSPQPLKPAQTTSTSRPEHTSGALVLNINAPLSNYAGDNTTGSPTGGTTGSGQATDLFQRKNNPPFTPDPNANPAQQLQDAYANALTVRNDAEQARTNFLNLANQLENQALNKSGQAAFAQPQPAANNPFAQSPAPFQPAAPQPVTFQPPPPAAFQAPPPPVAQPDPTQQFQQQLMNLQQQPQAQQAFPQQPAYDPMAQQQALMQQMPPQQPQMDPMLQQQMMQQAQMDPMMQQQLQQQMMQQQPQMDPMMQQQLQQQMMQQGQMDPMMQQQMMQQAQMDPMMQQQMMQQGQMDPMMQQQMMQQQGLAGANVADLNNMIAQPRTPDEKLMAMNEIAGRQQGDRQTYELLKQEAATPMQGVPPETANAIRQAALLALGSLNGSPVNAQTSTNQLYGLDAINRILGNKNENPTVKASAVTALGLINRPQDKTIQNLLKKAAKDSNPDVKNAVAQVQAGQMINPAQAGAAQPGFPQ